MHFSRKAPGKIPRNPFKSCNIPKYFRFATDTGLTVCLTRSDYFLDGHSRKKKKVTMKRARPESNESDGDHPPKRVHLEDKKEDFYFRTFTDRSEPPTEIASKLSRLWDTHKSYTKIPIKLLSHVTHDWEKRQITTENEDSYIFKPGAKNGKYDNSIFIDDETRTRRLIGVGGSLLPGYLSWWGITTADWYATSEKGKELRRAIEELHKERIFAPHFLESPESSRYGGNSFKASFHTLIKKYKESRSDCKSKNVYLLKAGTLQYRYESCYVIMVCMEEDMERDPQLTAMSSIYGETIFKNNGCINKEGKIVNPRSVPSFRAKNLVKANYQEKEKQYYDYEEIAFAFYFQEDQEFLIPKNRVTMVKISHNDIYCIKRERKEEESGYICPDQQ